MKGNPRLANLHRRHPGAEEGQPTQHQEAEPIQQRGEQLQPESVPRPIYPPSNIVPTYTKFSLNPNGPSYPSADSLFSVANSFDAGPNFLRVTTGVLPMHPKKVTLPLGAWIMPLGPDSYSVPSITVRAPLRCTRCKAYVNAYFKIDATNNVGCNLCGHRYTSQQKIDPAILNSTELYTSGVLDFKVSDPMYFKKDFSKVKIMLLIELTRNMIDTGLFESTLSAVKSTLESGQFESGVRIGIATYSQATTFYRVRNVEEEVIEYVVGDPIDALCPLSENDLFFNPSDEVSRAKALYLIDRIIEKSRHFKNINNTTNYYSAVSCASTGFGNNAGRIVLFSVNDPVNTPGKLRPREKEQIKTPLKPIHEEYQALAKDLVKKRVGLDHFLFGREGHLQHELATTHFLSSLTGGNLYHYLVYTPTFDSEHLYFSIYGNLTRECVYDVNFTCRMSNGLSTTKYLIGDGFHEDRDVSLGVLDASQSVSVWFDQQEKLTEGAFLQFAIMFTNARSERVIRIFNYKFLVSEKLDQVHQGCDSLALASHLCKEHANEITRQPDPIKIIDGLYTSICTILQQYRLDRGEAKYSELQLHPNMKNMLCYIHGVLTSNIFTNLGRNVPDTRLAELLKLNTAGFLQFANRFYPKLYSVDLDIYNTEGAVPGDMIEQSDVGVIPSNLPLLASSIRQESAYLFNNGEYLYLFVMPHAQPDLLTELFGVGTLQEVTTLPELETGHSVRVANIIQQLRRRQPSSTFYLPLLLLTHTPTSRAQFESKMGELLKQDNRERPYVQFLKQLHARIQTK